MRSSSARVAVGADAGLLVAVAVQDDPPAGERRVGPQDEVARRRSPRRAGRRPGAPDRRRPRRARRPAAATRYSSRSVSRHDGSTPTIGVPRARVAREAVDHRARHPPRVLEQALRDARPPAAAGALQPHAPPGALEQLDRRAPDPGLGEGRERVGEQDDVAARRRGAPRRSRRASQRSSVSRSKRGSGRSARDPERALEQRARAPGTPRQHVRQRRERGAQRG